MSVSAGTSRARSSRPVYETKRTSCPASSHQTPTTWGMMLAKLGCMTWLQRASFGPPVIRSRMQTRRCLTGPPNRASLAGGVPLGWLRHDIPGDHAGHDLAPGDPGEVLSLGVLVKPGAGRYLGHMTDTQVVGRSAACTWGPARGQLPELTFLRYLGFPRKYTRTGHYSSRSPSDRRVTKTAAVRPGTVKEPLDRSKPAVRTTGSWDAAWPKSGQLAWL